MATELPSKSSDTSMGVKQSSSLTLPMYVRMYVFGRGQDGGWSCFLTVCSLRFAGPYIRRNCRR